MQMTARWFYERLQTNQRAQREVNLNLRNQFATRCGVKETTLKAAETDSKHNKVRDNDFKFLLPHIVFDSTSTLPSSSCLSLPLVTSYASLTSEGDT